MRYGMVFIIKMKIESRCEVIHHLIIATRFKAKRLSITSHDYKIMYPEFIVSCKSEHPQKPPDNRYLQEKLIIRQWSPKNKW